MSYERPSYVPDWHDTGACMDLRHIDWLYHVLKVVKPKRTLEIGGYTGCSSAAFVAAGIPDAHFAEISPNDKFRSVVQGHGTIHQRKGREVIASEAPFDLVLIDGAHDMDSVMEELEALKVKGTWPKIIVAHDVNSTAAGYAHCEGAGMIPTWMEHHGPEMYYMTTDSKERQGEATQRGMFIIWTEPAYTKLIDTAMELAGIL